MRGRYLLALDLAGIVVASYFAIWLRFDSVVAPISLPALPIAVALLLATRTVVYVKLGLYSRRWRFASIPELERIAAAVVLGSLISIIGFYVIYDISRDPAVDAFPKSFWAAEALLSVVMVGGVRFAIRAAYHHTQSFRWLAANGPRNAAVWSRSGWRRCRALGAARARAGFRPVGFLDDDPGSPDRSWPTSRYSGAWRPWRVRVNTGR